MAWKNTQNEGTLFIILWMDLCVSNIIDEALELREAGIEETILILGVIMPDEVVYDYHVTFDGC